MAQAGGTWLAISRSGRFATVTNYQDVKPPSPDCRSRGFLVTGFVDGDLAPRDYLATIEQDRYSDSTSLSEHRRKSATCRIAAMVCVRSGPACTA